MRHVLAVPDQHHVTISRNLLCVKGNAMEQLRFIIGCLTSSNKCACALAFQHIQDLRFLVTKDNVCADCTEPSHWAPQISSSECCKVFSLEICRRDIKKLVRFQPLNLARSAALEDLHISALSHYALFVSFGIRNQLFVHGSEDAMF